MLKKYLYFVSLFALIFIFIVSLVFLQRDTDTQSEQYCQHQKRVLPIYEKSGLTLPELLKLDSVKKVYELSTGKYDDYTYFSDESNTLIVESAVRELILNSDSVTIHLRKNYVDEWDHYTIEDKKFLQLFSKNFALESNIVIYPLGGTISLLNEYITFEPSGLAMYVVNCQDAFKVWDSCTPVQIGIFKKVNSEFELLYLYYFENLIIKYLKQPLTFPDRHIYQRLIDENQNLEETLETFKREISPYRFPTDDLNTQNE